MLFTKITRNPAAILSTLLYLSPPLAHPDGTRTAAEPFRFEVATIRQDDPAKMVIVGLRVYPGGHLVIHGHSLRTLISEAFDVPGPQIVSGGKWLDSLRFDVDAKSSVLEGDGTAGEFSVAGIKNSRVRGMLRSLLIERFDLKFHLVQQVGAVYLLERGNGPLKLERADGDLYTHSDSGTVIPTHTRPSGDVGVATGEYVGMHRTSIEELANTIGGILQVPVRDLTGLPGYYNFKSDVLVSDEDFKGEGPMHLLVDIIPEMGLKLRKAKGVVEKLVIDTVELPTSN